MFLSVHELAERKLPPRNRPTTSGNAHDVILRGRALVTQLLEAAQPFSALSVLGTLPPLGDAAAHLCLRSSLHVVLL